MYTTQSNITVGQKELYSIECIEKVCCAHFPSCAEKCTLEKLTFFTIYCRKMHCLAMISILLSMLGRKKTLNKHCVLCIVRRYTVFGSLPFYGEEWKLRGGTLECISRNLWQIVVHISTVFRDKLLSSAVGMLIAFQWSIYQAHALCTV